MEIIIMDFETTKQWITFILGTIATIISLIIYMKNQGLVFFSSKKIEDGRAQIKDGLEKIDALTADCAIVQDAKAVVGNISPSELSVILTVAADRASQTGGYTLKDAEEIGEMIIKAAKTGGN
jgi:hypothetical protein